MPPIDPPDQTQANGTRKKAIGWRVETPSSKPFPRRVSQVPLGGRERSTGVDEVATASEKLEVVPQRRQRAISVETFTSASGISALQLGQIALELMMLVKVTAHPIYRYSRDRSQSSQHRSQVSLFFQGVASSCRNILKVYDLWLNAIFATAGFLSEDSELRTVVFAIRNAWKGRETLRFPGAFQRRWF